MTADIASMPIQDRFNHLLEGDIDALSGATVTSRGVCGAVTEAAKIYAELKPELEEKVKTVGQ